MRSQQSCRQTAEGLSDTRAALEGLEGPKGRKALTLLWLTLGVPGLFAAEWTNDLIAHYRFETNGLDCLGRSPAFVVLNVSQSLAGGNYVPSFRLADPPFTNGVLFVDGRYEPNARFINYLGTAPIMELDYHSFTLALDFYPVPATRSRISMSQFENRLDKWTRGRYSRWIRVDPTRFNTINILTGGYYSRWIGFNRDDGYLSVTLNNQAFVHRFDKARVKPGRWHRLICSFDYRQRKILTMFDGHLLETVALPSDFKLAVDSDFFGPDREFTFSNMSNGSVYYGYAAHLKIFRRALAESELAAVDKESLGEVPSFPPAQVESKWVWLLAVAGAVAVLVVWRRRAKKGSRPRPDPAAPVTP